MLNSIKNNDNFFLTAKGSFAEISDEVKETDIFMIELKTLFNNQDIKSIQHQLQTDLNRERCVSDNKGFAADCFDYKHHLQDGSNQGSYTQGSITGRLFVDLALQDLYLSNAGNVDRHNAGFYYQGDDNNAYSFSISFQDYKLLNKQMLFIMFVDDFKKDDINKRGLFIGSSYQNTPEYFASIKQTIAEKIRSNVIKEYLLLELFKQDGSFNIEGIKNFEQLFSGKNIIDSQTINKRMKQLIYDREGYLTYYATNLSDWWRGENSRQIDSKSKEEGVSEQIVLPIESKNSEAAVSITSQELDQSEQTTCQPTTTYYQTVSSIVIPEVSSRVKNFFWSYAQKNRGSSSNCEPCDFSSDKVDTLST